MEADDDVVDFYEMGLDERILKAIAKLGWGKPTLIQEKTIPLALEGKDVLARARTGTGKTGCFLIPMIQKILSIKKSSREQSVRAIIMTPSKELCNQAYQNLHLLTNYCAKEIRGMDISGQVALSSQKPMLMDKPDIVVGTPSRFIAHLKAGNLQIKDSVEMVVVDEADLVFSFGYESDMKALMSYFPKIYQAFLMSATLSDDVRSIKRLMLHNPVIVKLEETSLPDTTQLTQYHIKCEDEDKFLLLYTLVKLNLIRGKSLVFVNSVDRCYKLKLFLGHVGILSCVLNPELPINSRCHIVDQFNTGTYDIIIASDEIPTESSDQKTKKEKKNRSKSNRKDTEYGVARGIDFQGVSNVINFDLPASSQAYIHRVGRTARGKNQGAALSFISIAEMARFESIKKQLADEYTDVDSVFQPFNFRMEEIEGFRYRARDAYRATTGYAVRKARLGEIKHEMFTSEKLKTYFEENPRDKQILRHDTARGVVKLQQHLKNVPDYIIPETLKAQSSSRKRKRDFKPKKVSSRSQQNYKKKKSDALKSLELSASKRGGAKKKRNKTNLK